MSDAALFFVHAVDVETRTGENGLGPAYADSVTIPCFLDDSTHLVQDTEGNEIVSSTIVYADITSAATFAINSKVTANGRTARVITLNAYDSATLGLPDHVEVHLT